MRASISKAILVTGAAGLVIGLAACSSSGGGSSSSSAAAPASASSSSAPKPLADLPALTGKDTSVALDPGFVTALTTLKLTPGVIGTATLDASTGTVSFPITGGNVKYYTPGTVKPYVQGDIQHMGSGLSLTGGGITVSLTNFDINPGNNSELYGDVSANGTSVGTHLPLFDLDGSTLKPLQVNAADGTAVLTGTTVHVSSAAAMLLDQTFKTTAVTAGFLVGVATITVNTK